MENLKTGMIVKIEGGYFKNDNGYFRVKNSPGDESWNGKDFCLKKVNKKDFSDSISKNTTSFWPLFVTTNSYEKKFEAKSHNAKHAKITIVGKVKMFKIKVIQNWCGFDNERIEYTTESQLEEIKQQKRTTIEIIETLN